MMKLKSKPKIDLERSSTIFALMFVAMVIVVASILISKQLFESIRFTHRVISKHNDTKEVLEQNVRVLPELKSNYEILQTEGPASDKVLRALPTEINFPGLATLVEQLAAVSNVRLTAISIDEQAVANTQATIVTATPTEGASEVASEAVPPSDGTELVPEGAEVAAPEEVNFVVSVTGKYADILKFFDALETAIRPMKVVDVAIEGEGNALTAKLNAATYFQAATTFKAREEVVR
jgi:Tfp pilus assembly protein PilO